MSECMKLETKTTWHVCPVNRPLGKARLCTMKIVANALERQSILSSMLSSLILTLCVFIVHHSQPFFSSLSLENPVHQPIGWFGPYRKEFHRKHYKVLSVSKQGCYIRFHINAYADIQAKAQSAVNTSSNRPRRVRPCWRWSFSPSGHHQAAATSQNEPECAGTFTGDRVPVRTILLHRIKTMHFSSLLLSKLQADHHSLSC